MPPDLTSSGSHRYLPTAALLAQLSPTLPDAESWGEETLEATVNDVGYTVVLRRIKLRTPQGSIYRWIYDGKVLVD